MVHCTWKPSSLSIKVRYRHALKFRAFISISTHRFLHLSVQLHGPAVLIGVVSTYRYALIITQLTRNMPITYNRVGTKTSLSASWPCAITRTRRSYDSYQYQGLLEPLNPVIVVDKRYLRRYMSRYRGDSPWSVGIYCTAEDIIRNPTHLPNVQMYFHPDFADARTKQTKLGRGGGYLRYLIKLNKTLLYIPT